MPCPTQISDNVGVSSPRKALELSTASASDAHLFTVRVVPLPLSQPLLGAVTTENQITIQKEHDT